MEKALKPVVEMKGKEISGIKFVEKEIRDRGPRGKYYDRLREEIGNYAIKQTSPCATRVHNTIRFKVAPAIIRQFRKKYSDKDKEGFAAYKDKHDEDLKRILDFVISKIGSVTVVNSYRVYVIWDGEEIRPQNNRQMKKRGGRINEK